MGRRELERLSKEEMIELVLRLQRPDKTSRTSSKPPSTDRKLEGAGPLEVVQHVGARHDLRQACASLRDLRAQDG
ncbi:hypothetical protein [Methylobacterium nodulans]|uniref:Uncharacterized protein n=1 Tax=Methylobacterium nodulans (strain LMG 21967 / CNCM I-2342 / ORS 2060) TaxID=460265 RepID=B8IMH7_METNO|nr:hypothetical protein [Methylobacterium nodulans]ACL58363.1 hypothetical protein Mnod_3451 [Methylobacterium nodulans ORS 2060]